MLRGPHTELPVTSGSLIPCAQSKGPCQLHQTSYVAPVTVAVSEAVAILASVDGGISTQNTPSPSRTGQAAKCEGANAFSAATSMYCPALEQCLCEQGFQTACST